MSTSPTSGRFGGLFLALLLQLLQAHGASAHVWSVIWDPVNHVDQIGAVVLQTGDGDTILVGPGTYYEHITLPNHSLTFLSTTGSGTAILDGSVSGPGSRNSILYASSVPLSQVAVHGFTLRGGTGSDVGYSDLGGGAIVFKGKKLELSNCVLEGNSVRAFPGGASGGAFYLSAPEVFITDCVIRDNHADSEGGDVFVGAGQCVLTNCAIEVADQTASNGRSIYAGENVTLFRLDGCTMTGSGDADHGSAIYCLAQRAEVVGNRFMTPPGQDGTYMLFASGGEVDPYPREITMSGNLFIGGSGGESAQSLQVHPSEGTVTAERNTFVSVAQVYSMNAGGGLYYRNNINVASAAWIFVPSGGSIECNDVWPDSGSVEVAVGPFFWRANVSCDPLFCNPTGGDYRLAEQSGCTADNAPEGCGLIGAFGVGCQETPVERVTWGRVKGLFR